MTETDVNEARPVHMTLGLANVFGLTDRLNGVDASTGVVWMTEAELLSLGSDWVVWGEPDEHGWYIPTLHSKPAEPYP
jgi:hypothetical protein